MRKVLTLVFLLTTIIAAAQNVPANSLYLIPSSLGQIGAVNNGKLYQSSSDGLIYYREGGVWKNLTEKYTGTSPTTVTVGGLAAGTSISGQTLHDIIQSIVSPYVNPVFTAFSVSGQATTIEVGTTLSGSKTFTWSITQNSGVVSTIDIRDVTASTTLLAGTPNDGTQAATVTTLQLNSNGATQVWRGIGNNSSPPGTFNSSDFTVTGRFLRFYGPASAAPTNSAEVRALPDNDDFHTGATTFNLNTGTTLTRFVVALPPSVTISGVIDLDALNANITAEYVLTGTINVLDAGGTNRSYNIYQMTIGAPYSTSHRHAVTTAN